MHVSNGNSSSWTSSIRREIVATETKADLG